MEKQLIELNKKCYDTLAKEYDETNNANGFGKQLAQELNNALEEYTKKENYRVLELGCGTGHVLAGFMELPNSDKYKLYGIEFSENMAKYAKKNCPQAIIANINILDIDDIFTVFNEKDKFDIIIMASFIHLFPRKEAEILLKKVKEWLNPDGLIYISTTVESEDYEGVQEKNKIGI